MEDQAAKGTGPESHILEGRGRGVVGRRHIEWGQVGISHVLVILKVTVQQSPAGHWQMLLLCWVHMQLLLESAFGVGEAYHRMALSGVHTMPTCFLPDLHKHHM
jgi:hypothetical protein